MAIIDKLSRYYNEEEVLNLSGALKDYNEKLSITWENTTAEESPESVKNREDLVNSLFILSRTKEEVEEKAFERYLKDIEKTKGKILVEDIKEILDSFTLADFERDVRFRTGYFSRTAEGCNNYIKNILLKHQYNAAEKLNYSVQQIDERVESKVSRLYPGETPPLNDVIMGLTNVQQRIFSTPVLFKNDKKAHSVKVDSERNVIFEQDQEIISEHGLEECLTNVIGTVYREAAATNRLTREGYAHISLKELIYTIKDFVKGKCKNDTLGEELPKRIDDSIIRLAGETIRIHDNGQIKAWNKNKNQYEEAEIDYLGQARALLPVERIQIGTEIHYFIKELPVLLDYAEKSGQLLSIPIAKRLEGSRKTKLSSEEIVIHDYLVKRLGGMRRNAGKSSRFCDKRILIENIYQAVSLDKAGGKGEILPSKLSKLESHRIREKTRDILDDIKNQKQITGFERYTLVDFNEKEYNPAESIPPGIRLKGFDIYFSVEKKKDNLETTEEEKKEIQGASKPSKTSKS